MSDIFNVDDQQDECNTDVAKAYRMVGRLAFESQGEMRLARERAYKLSDSLTDSEAAWYGSGFNDGWMAACRYIARLK